MNYTTDELILEIVNWAGQRGLLEDSAPEAQFIKLIEELAEVGDAIRLQDLHKLRDGIGDMIVVLIILAELCSTDLNECLEQAYYEIKYRKGKMVDGIFVKEE